MKIRNLLCLIFALILLCSLSSCKENPAAPDDNVTENQTDNPSDQKESKPATSTENPITFFSMTYGHNFENIINLTVYSLDANTMQIEYTGSERKIGICEQDALDTITYTLSKTKLADLNSKEVYEEGEASGSMYVEYADGTVLSTNFSGKIPEEFIAGFSTMDACFQALTSHLPVYIPQPIIMGNVDPIRLSELQAILNYSGMKNLDAFLINEVPMDSEFAFTMGLRNADSIIGGSSVSGAMMTDAYSLSIVTLKERSNIQKVRDDFEKNLDWTKWVCVMPTHALIAQKGDMVLCLMGADAQFDSTKAGIEAAGWENIMILEAKI